MIAENRNAKADSILCKKHKKQFCGLSLSKYAKQKMYCLDCMQEQKPSGLVDPTDFLKLLSEKIEKLFLIIKLWNKLSNDITESLQMEIKKFSQPIETYNDLEFAIDSYSSVIIYQLCKNNLDNFLEKLQDLYKDYDAEKYQANQEKNQAILEKITKMKITRKSTNSSERIEQKMTPQAHLYQRPEKRLSLQYFPNQNSTKKLSEGLTQEQPTQEQPHRHLQFHLSKSKVKIDCHSISPQSKNFDQSAKKTSYLNNKPDGRSLTPEKKSFLTKQSTPQKESEQKKLKCSGQFGYFVPRRPPPHNKSPNHKAHTEVLKSRSPFQSSKFSNYPFQQNQLPF